MGPPGIVNDVSTARLEDLSVRTRSASILGEGAGWGSWWRRPMVRVVEGRPGVSSSVQWAEGCRCVTV
jgi:hypothetical protein